MARVQRVVVILAVLLAASFNAAIGEVIEAGGGFTVSVEDGRSIAVKHADRELFEIQKLGIERFRPDVDMQFGFFDFDRENLERDSLRFRYDPGGVIVYSRSGDAGRIYFEQTAAGNLRVRFSLEDSLDADGVLVQFGCDDDDRFWGFGEQYSYIDFRGVDVPVWVSEQGVGREKNPRAPYIGELTDTYFPMPYFIDPEKGKGFLLENSEYSEFRIPEKGNDSWLMEVWSGKEISFLAFPGPGAKDVIMQLTSEVGRPKSVPPDWSVKGVWLSAQGGTEAVSARLDTALEAGIPVSAVWSQDWVGARHFGGGNFGVRYNWEHDKEWYPGLEEMIAKYREKGVRFLGYFNNFVLEDGQHFEEMAEKGYLIKNRSGEPYVFNIINFRGSLIDVTNPGAVEYFQEYARRAVEMGQSGWMQDFGEWLPFDAVLANGDAASFHNKYPIEWHRIAREVLEEAYPDGDFVLLTRSGFTGEQEVAHVVWAADQEADFDENDGMPTVVTAALNIGFSGVPYFTHDIGGFSGGPRDKETFLRWTELGAFTPFMRTHNGLQKMKNHEFDSDPETLEFFTEFTRIHSELFPYFKKLLLEAKETGLPAIRHTVLADPEWDESYQAHSQWMLGDDMLFAPVVERGADEVTVAFPEGEWEHLFTGEKFEGRKKEKIAAPIGTPAVFVRTGSMPDIAGKVRSIHGGG